MSDNKGFFDELSKMAGSVFGSAVQAKDELVKFINTQIDSFLKGKNFVSRDEFESLKKKVDKLVKKPKTAEKKPKVNVKKK